MALPAAERCLILHQLLYHLRGMLEVWYLQQAIRGRPRPPPPVRGAHANAAPLSEPVIVRRLKRGNIMQLSVPAAMYQCPPVARSWRIGCICLRPEAASHPVHEATWLRRCGVKRIGGNVTGLNACQSKLRDVNASRPWCCRVCPGTHGAEAANLRFCSENAGRDAYIQRLAGPEARHLVRPPSAKTLAT